MEKLLALFCLLFSWISTGAQIDGLWKIDRVLVGEETMTPVAKWSRLELTDTAGQLLRGSVMNGNGGIINFRGRWQYDRKNELFSSFNEVGDEDAYGPFSVDRPNGESMIWRRFEEGHQIEVHLSRADQLPKAPWDQIVGLWSIAEISNGTPFEEGERWFIRWDRVFVRRSMADNRVIQNGVWHMNAHRPELTLWHNDQKASSTIWKISFTGPDAMHWQSSEPARSVIFRK